MTAAALVDWPLAVWMLAPFAVPLVILFAAGLAADLLGAAVLPVFAADSLVQLVFGFQRPVVFALEPEPLFAVELAVDSICAAFQPVSGVDSLLEQPSAVPLPFEQHQPLAVAAFSGLLRLLVLDSEQG